MRVLFIDDEEWRFEMLKARKHFGEYSELVHVNDANKAMALLKKGPWDSIWFDYDLNTYTSGNSGHEVKGYDVAIAFLAISKMDNWMPSSVIVHSANVFGAKLICNLFTTNNVKFERRHIADFMLNNGSSLEWGKFITAYCEETNTLFN